MRYFVLVNETPVIYEICDINATFMFSIVSTWMAFFLQSSIVEGMRKYDEPFYDYC